MICPIVKYPSEILRKVQSEFDSRAHGHIIQDLFDTLEDSDGLGLAAIQIGYPVKLFVLNPRYFINIKSFVCMRNLVFPNAYLVSQNGVQHSFEGCLSIPNISIEMERPTEITMRFGDTAPNSKWQTLSMQGRDCAVFCHEIDHTLGRLILDYQWELE